MRQPHPSVRSPRAQVTSELLTTTITPSSLAAYGQCPLYFREIFEGRGFTTTRAIQRGQHIHRLAAAHASSRIEGGTPSIDKTLNRVSPPLAFMDGGEEEESIFQEGRDALLGLDAWMQAQEFTQILATEQYIRTVRRPVAGVPQAGIIFSGRADLVCLTHTGGIAVIDLKLTSIPGPDDLLKSPASWVYRHLALHAYDTQEIQIIQLVPSTGQSTAVRLGAEQIERGAVLARALCGAAQSGDYSPHIGPYCSYCDYVDRCPAHAGRPGASATDPF